MLWKVVEVRQVTLHQQIQRLVINHLIHHLLHHLCLLGLTLVGEKVLVRGPVERTVSSFFQESAPMAYLVELGESVLTSITRGACSI